MKQSKFLILCLTLSLISCNNQGDKSPTDKKQEEEIVEETKKQPIEISDIRTIHTDLQKEYLDGNYLTLPNGVKGTSEYSKPNPVKITVDESTKYAKTDVTEYKLKLCEDTKFEKCVEYSSTTGEFSLLNFNINKDYYYKYTAFVGETAYESEVKAFFVEGTGPRNLNIDGITNVRDLGGWKIKGTNKRVPQNLIYRSGRLHDSTKKVITDLGIEQLKALGIKTEIDLRLYSEIDEVNNTQKPLTDFTYYHFPMTNSSSYKGELSKSGILSAMQIFANKDNYPIIYHCYIGTDRTGFISFALNALAGVDNESLYRDYLFSNFGNIGGSRNKSIIDGYISDMLQLGSTVGEGVEKFLLSIGVTQQEINSIKSILTQEEENTFDGHVPADNYQFIDSNYHKLMCSDCEYSLLKDTHHFSTPFLKDGILDKHFVTCKECGFEKEINHKFIFKQFVTEPTESSKGKAIVYCEDCHLGDKEIDLPKVTSDDYLITQEARLFNNKVVEGKFYTLKDTTYGEISGCLNPVEIKNYIKIGNTYMTPSSWNDKYPNAQISESGEVNGKILTITLNDTTDIALGDSSIDLTTYKKVIINGSGTLNLNYTVTGIGMIVNDLEIAQSATVNFNGVDRLTTASSNCSKNCGIKLFGNLTISGKLYMSNLSAAIYADSTINAGLSITISNTGTLKTELLSNGLYIESPLTFTNNGTLDLALNSKATTGYNFATVNSTLKFVGNSSTKLESGYGIAPLKSSNKVEIFIQDNSTFEANNYNGTFINYTTLVVGNGLDGSTTCNASVSLARLNAAPIKARPVANTKSLTVINSTLDFTVTGKNSYNVFTFDGSNAGTSNVFKALSNVTITGCKNLFRFDNAPKFNAGDFITTNLSGNPTIKVDSTFTADYYNTPIPENLPNTITKRA